MKTHFNKGLLTPHTVASLLGVSAGTLALWRCTGRYKLPFVKVGRKVMYDPVAIQNFIADRTQNQTGNGGDYGC